MNVGLSQVVYMETCQNRNFYFELLHEVPLFVFFGCDGPIKMANVDQNKRKAKVGTVIDWA
jgi:hypothetical protein